MELKQLFEAYAIIALAAIIAGVYTVYQFFFSPLARIPGPFIAKISPTYYTFIAKRGRIHRDLANLHRKYGKAVRIAPNVLSVIDPTAFREIYKAGNRFWKAESYSVLQGSRPFDLAGQRNEKIHSEQRKLVARAYSMDSITYLEPQVNSVLVSLVNRLRGIRAQPIDLGYWIQLFAFDTIGAISFSKPFGYVESGDDERIFLRLRKAFRCIGWIKHSSTLFKVHQRLMPYIGNWLASNDRNTYFFELASKEIQARTNRDGDFKDIVSQLFSVQKAKPEFNDTNLAFMMTTNVFAGSDTTSTSLRAIFYLLLKYPEKYNRLMEELESKRQAGELSNPVTFNEAEAWPYLQAIMYEATRLYPAVCDLLDRDVPEGGMTIDRYYVPGGVVVGTSAWVIHRAQEIWGPDAEEFRPERWLEKENEGTMKRFFFSFGGGSRTCIGRHISWLEIGKLVPTLLMCFDMRLANGAELKEEHGTLLFLDGLEVYMTPREV
ncbi:cytochrome P450 [Daldinia caldariorum]|uniref:cytochrome P450 n=1 Tax=Daldinia caldariorum TaxID=326644 RepID=UPI00200786B0|nr:cytochrome P450 [Daldinia caldariorum]KAI1465333.1 cytochrome P450 [Daldinia caldariorum]